MNLEIPYQVAKNGDGFVDKLKMKATDSWKGG